MRGAIFGNVGTLVSFQLGAEDADYVAREFQPVSPQELTELANHHIYLKLKVKSVTSSPLLCPHPPAPAGRDLLPGPHRATIALLLRTATRRGGTARQSDLTTFF